jgi:hypothetical protein
MGAPTDPLLEIAAVLITVFGPLLALFAFLEWRLRRHGYRWALPSRIRPDHTFSGDAASFRGGGRIGLWNATWPFVTLTADRSWAQVGGLVPSVWVDRAKVTEVQTIGSLVSPGVRFATADGAYDGLIFWTFSGADVLRSLNVLGWPVAGLAPPCAHCGAHSEALAKYCHSCGSQLTGGIDAG